MASSYKSLRCDCCAGTLEYNKGKKVWVCKYCGNEVRREEEYDGLFTIKNVVKQTLMDLADGRLDSAERNLAECEKIDTRYVGTCLARLCVELYTVITPAPAQRGKSKGIFGRMKRDYDALQAIDSGISTEEEALYESFDGAADAFGVLYLTLDSLGDQIHRDFVEGMMDCGAIYSRSLNERLLHVFLKSGKMEQVDKIHGNEDNIDCRAALFCTLQSYEDGEAKRAHISALTGKAGLQPDDRKEIERYLKESPDSPETKRIVYCAAANVGAPASIDYVTDYVLEPAGDDEEAAREILRALCGQHPNDQTVYFLLDRILTRYGGGVAAAELEELADQDIFVVVPGKTVTAMLNRADLTAEEKLRLLELCHRFRIDARTDDAILSAYLCGGGAPDERRKVLSALLSYVKTLSTAALERYVLGCTDDGLEKTQILEQLLKLDLNKSFFRDL